MFKYGIVKTWEPRPVEGGFLLSSPDTLRCLLVTEEGVSECDPAGKPIALIDCGPGTLEKLKLQITPSSGS